MATEVEQPTYRIGEVAERVGVTIRTIRYYEERGLLDASAGRTQGSHRLYTDADVTHLIELIRLRDLLGLSLEELEALAVAEEARAALRNQWAESASNAERIQILDAAIPLVERQLELVRARQRTVDEFAAALADKLESLQRRRLELEAT